MSWEDGLTDFRFSAGSKEFAAMRLDDRLNWQTLNARIGFARQVAC